MFHVMLILIPIGFLAIIVSLLLFGITTIMAGLVGGTAATLLVKNKTARKLLLIGFFTISLVGLLGLLPIVIASMGLPAICFTVSSVFIYTCVAVLALIGIKLAKSIKNNIGKTVLIIIFCTLLIAALSLLIFTLLATHFLLSA